MNTPSANVVDFSRSGISRYIQLSILFRRRIESGQWPLGSQIPTVDELASECGVARATIRQALDALARDGLIERFRAKGTFVRRQPQEAQWCEVGTNWSGLLRPSSEAEIEVLTEARDVPLQVVPYQIGDLAGAYRHLRRKHRRPGDKPFLLADVYIDERLMSRISREDIRTKTAFRLIHDIPGLEIVDARQIVTIGTADPEISELLELPLNAPVAFVHRRAVAADQTLALVAEGIYRGDVLRFDIKLR